MNRLNLIWSVEVLIFNSPISSRATFKEPNFEVIAFIGKIAQALRNFELESNEIY
jgi:hypothetical protein